MYFNILLIVLFRMVCGPAQVMVHVVSWRCTPVPLHIASVQQIEIHVKPSITMMTLTITNNVTLSEVVSLHFDANNPGVTLHFFVLCMYIHWSNVSCIFNLF